MAWQNNASDEETLSQQMVEIVVRKISPVTITIILFGSRARGDSRPDSDIDLLIVKNDHSRRSVAAERKRRVCISH